VYYGSALSSTTVPGSIEVAGDYSVNMFRILFDAKKYFFEGEYDDGGLYGLVGIGLSLASTKENVGSYDATQYAVSAGTSESYSQFYIRIHAGYDIKLDAFSIFIEPGLDLSANSQNGEEVAITIPSLYNINGGIRFPLD
jgi:hypothetical protein